MRSAIFPDDPPWGERPRARPVTSALRRLDPAFFRRAVTEVARDLIGVRLVVAGVGGLIVEDEAYHHADPASHAFRGHWRLNLVCGVEPGSAVLIRALEPTDGIEIMRARRGVSELRKLCPGPGRLCQALSITRAAPDGVPLDRPPFLLSRAEGGRAVVSGRRIGITKGVDTPWRFGLKGSPYLSRPL
jgi:DNA-3-methyladenine glycosylase